MVSAISRLSPEGGGRFLFCLYRRFAAYIEAKSHIRKPEPHIQLRPMTDVVENQIETETLEEYDDAMRSGDTDWLNDFWDDVAEETGYTKQQLINSILDEYNRGEINKTAMDYYMSTLVQWPGS